jgi:hypothetical protein
MPTVDRKIQTDLGSLVEKMDLCDKMLRPGGGDPAPSVVKDEVLMQVIGFLEACAPRMLELVDAAAQGAVGEETLMTCLEVNDRLIKQLADIGTVALTESPATTTAASVPASEFDDLLLDDDDEPITKPTTLGATKSTGTEDDDPFATFDQPSSTTSNDEFDSFFNERTQKSG